MRNNRRCDHSRHGHRRKVGDNIAKGIKERKEEIALEITQKELIDILQSSAKRLDELLNSTDVLYDKRLQIILGAIDNSDPVKVRTLFNDNGRIPVENLPLESDLIDFRKKCTNDASNAGAQSILLTPAANSIVTIYMIVQKSNEASITQSAKLRTAGASELGIFYSTAPTANTQLVYPRSVSGTNYFDPMDGGFILTDAFELLLITGSIAVTKIGYFIIFYSYTGNAPTFTYTQPTGAVWSALA